MLKERGLTGSVYGQMVLIAALISNFATLLLLSLVLAVASKALSLDLRHAGGRFVAFAGMARLSHWVRRLPGLGRALDELAHATAPIRVRGAFAAMIIRVVLAEALGVEVILGAFLAGAVISLAQRHRRPPCVRSSTRWGLAF